jgi:hypothetical protein
MIGSAPPSQHTPFRRIGVFGAVLLAGSAFGVALAPSASANPLPSTTTVTASPQTSTAGDAVTLTAKVAAAVVGGVIVSPSGPVAFSASNGTGSTPLGSATLGSCLLSACTATLTTTAIPAGSTSVIAAYGGDGLVAGSSGSTPVTVNPATQTGNGSTATCDPGVICDSGVLTSNNGSNSMEVVSSPSATRQTITQSLANGKNLHCPQNTDAQNGALGTFTVSANDTTITVSYTGFGNNARSMLANARAHPAFFGCYGQSQPWNGYVYGVYGPAVLVHENDGDFYEAQPASCAVNGGQLPCATLSSTNNSTTYGVRTQDGDPKVVA